MLGWEFPPFNSGGLGVACQGIARALSRLGEEITFVLPKKLDLDVPFMNVVFADVPKVRVTAVNSLLAGYITEERYRVLMDALPPELAMLYGQNLLEETQRYAEKAGALARIIDHDVIHAHDWLASAAGIAAKNASKKPLVVHVHATEFDRTADGNVNQQVYDIERAGMHAADRVVAVSEFTKQKLLKHYGIQEEKIRVSHNGIDFRTLPSFQRSKLKEHYRIVLFLGRLTVQKGPDYFLQAAKRVVEKDDRVLFVVTGSGDMDRQLIMEAANLGIAQNVIFTGFKRGDSIDRLYQMADVYVMPSVSEPFGITALESVQNGTPIIVSKQSGVREVIPDALQVDFWDVDKLSAAILSVLEHQDLHSSLRDRQRESLQFVTWEKSAKRLQSIYRELVPSFHFA